jgi:hypothetical protein
MAVRAIENLGLAQTRLKDDPSPATSFLPVLRMAIDRFCSLPDYTLRRLGRFAPDSEARLARFMREVEALRLKLGDDYLDKLHALSRHIRSEVIVAVELRQTQARQIPTV